MKSGKEILYLANYLQGFADANSKNNRIYENLYDASDVLRKLSPRVCGEGFICSGGDNCRSDHK